MTQGTVVFVQDPTVYTT